MRKSEVSANGILLSLISTFLLTTFSVLSMHWILTKMNTPANIFQDAYTYIMIISGGLITTIFYNLLSSYLRAVGNSQIPLVFLVFSAVLNVILDLILIIKFRMGVAGAGYATILSQGISAVFAFSLYLLLYAGFNSTKGALEVLFGGYPPSVICRDSNGTSVCNYCIRYDDYAVRN